MVKHEHHAIIIQTLITVWNLRIFFFLKYKKKFQAKGQKIQVQHEEL